MRDWRELKTEYKAGHTTPEMHAVFEKLFEDAMNYGVRPLPHSEAGERFLQLATDETKKRFFFYTLQRRVFALQIKNEIWKLIPANSNQRNDAENWHLTVVMREFNLCGVILQELSRQKLDWTEADFLIIFEHLRECDERRFIFENSLFKPLQSLGKTQSFSPELRALLLQSKSGNYCNDKEAFLFEEKMRKIVGEPSPVFSDEESWAKLALEELQASPNGESWQQLLEHCRAADGAEPTQSWRDEARKRAAAVDFVPTFVRWGQAFVSPVEPMGELNQATLKGLVWCAADYAGEELVQTIAKIAESGFKKTQNSRRGVHDRSTRVGNAAIWCLSAIEDPISLSQLTILRPKIKHGVAQKAIEKAIKRAAERLQVTPEDLEELAVPDFGLENGAIEREFGAASVQIQIGSGKAIWNWQSDGKAVKAVPASVKRDFTVELKELKTLAGELEKTFAAQKERLDSLLRTEKSWDFATWKTRYLEHPLLQILARRVIWRFDETAALPRENGFVNARGEGVEIPATASVRLWHPIFDAPESVLAWRRFLEENAVVQPFKQAHREVYLLTDAERQTRTYSNRFAAHILKQHQFNSLCAARGWKNSLRLMVDDSYPPATKTWPTYDLRAEFWIEGIGTEYGIDSNETGTFLRVSTDQVRFYRLDASQNYAHAGGGGYGAGYHQIPAEPVPLEEIPALIFSETMRDVDLFVGVASIGGDENWRDGGPDGHFRNYWQNYSFGELGETAKSRADVLSRLLPRLKIREKAQIDGRFLRVQGKKRAYKIHLGSGNILMEPNDQYLCIVPKSGGADEVFLPFEGDRTLAVILSKAFLLFEDDKIKDASIVRQIESG